MTAIAIIEFNTDNVMSEIERFDDCRAFVPFSIAEVARKHGAGRTPDTSIRSRLISLIKKMADGATELIQADVLAAAETENIASSATLRTIMMECAEKAGVNVIILRGRRGPRGPLGQRDETIIRERLLIEKLEELKETYPDGMDRAELEKVLADEGFSNSFIKAGVSPIAKQIGFIINDRKQGRKTDFHRIEITRQAMKAADAAGLKSRQAIIAAVLRYWAIHGVDGAQTESAAYAVMLAVKKMDAPKVEEPTNVETEIVAETVTEEAPF